MRTNLFSLFTFALFTAAAALVSSPAQTAPTPDASALLSPADLEQLVAPIALYPDPMVALILQAAAVPTDIVLADRYVQNGGDTNAIDSQNWDDSVKGLARYPDVLKMMDDNLDWTNQLGAAVLAQQDDVMAAIQAQRAKASALGNLETTSEQQVITDGPIIQIVPADPDVIYVPVYDPQVIYVERDPSLSFSIGFAMGAWIGGGFDWTHHHFYSHGYYRPGSGWRPHNGGGHVNPWRPNPHKPKPRPPFRPGRPGGHLPGFTRPPGGNKPGRPGGPGHTKPPINRPGNGNLPGNGNRPGHGNRPGLGKPAITHPEGDLPGQTKPAPGSNRPARPSVQHPGQPNHKPGLVRPNKPATRPAQPAEQRPAKPHVTRPAVTRPAAPAFRPAVQRPQQNPKRPALSRPTQARPAQARPAQAHPAPQAKGKPAAPNRKK